MAEGCAAPDVLRTIADVLRVGSQLEVGSDAAVLRSETRAEITGLRVLRRKELSRRLCVMTARLDTPEADTDTDTSDTPLLTVSVELGMLGSPDDSHLPATVSPLCPPVGSIMHVTGVVERTRRGVSGLCCTAPPTLVHLPATPPPRRAAGEGRLTSQRPSVCRKEWAKRAHGLGTGCPGGCGYRHDFDEGLLQGLQPHHPEGEGVKAKSERFALFAAFLLQAYGRERVLSGPVIDVAGGKGLLGVALAKACEGATTVVFDPSHHGRDTKTAALRAASGVRRVRQAVYADAVPSEVASVLQSASLVVGMHPDEATDGVVELALRHGLPFAVVPCCVFPSLFDRRLESGEAVVTTPQLVQHLAEAAAAQGVRTATHELPFRGRCTVLYSVPSGSPLQSA